MKQEQNTKAKHRGRAWLIVLIVLLLVVAALWLWQKNNIRSVKTALQYSSEELENQLQENEQVIQRVVEESDDIVIRPLSEEEQLALETGNMTVEEVAERLVGFTNADTEKTGATNTQEPQKPSSSKNELSDYQLQLSTLVARAVAMQGESVALLDQMEREGKAEILSLSPQERTTKAMMGIVRKYIGRATSLEAEYDKKMLQLTDEIEKLVAANHGDASLADTVLDTYIREKDLKKALYISKLQERGMTL